MFPYDDSFEEPSGIHDERSFRDERPTMAEGRRRERLRLAQDPSYQMGKMITAVIELRHDVDRLIQAEEYRRTKVPPRPSIRPQVATAGIAATISAAVIAIFQILQQLGVVK